MNKDGIEWHFIPPVSPNFRGLWEAGVRSVKTHLKRILGDTSLTYEVFSTTLISKKKVGTVEKSITLHQQTET